MTSEPPFPNPATLLAQADWVRALVRKLVADDSSADDVVQATWLAAMANPPHDGEEGPGLRAWLAKVSRHLALRTRRGATRRRTREEFAARPEALPSTADIVAREDARRRIVEAVLSLDEPYRSTLVLHFYEELAPRDIARVQGVNGSTVRNRLRRGLTLLRAKFEREEGGAWRQMCMLALPLASPTKPAFPVGRAAADAPRVPISARPPASTSASSLSSSSTGAAQWIVKGALMASSMKIAAVMVVAAGVVLFCWRQGEEHEPELVVETNVAAEHVELESPRGELASAPAPDETPREPGQRSIVTESHTALVAAESRTTLSGTLRTPDGAVIPRHALAAAKFSRRVGASGLSLSADAMDMSHGDTTSKSGWTLRTHVEFNESSVLSVGDRTIQLKFDMFPEPVEDSAHVVLTDEKESAFEGEVDGAGRFSFRNLGPGRWKLYAEAPGFLARRMTIDIRAGDPSKEVEVVMQYCQRLNVALRTPDGRDLVEAIAADPVLAGRVELVPFASTKELRGRVPGIVSGERSAAGVWHDRAELAADEAAPLVARRCQGVLFVYEPMPIHVGVSSRGFVLASKLVTQRSVDRDVRLGSPRDRDRITVELGRSTGVGVARYAPSTGTEDRDRSRESQIENAGAAANRADEHGSPVSAASSPERETESPELKAASAQDVTFVISLDEIRRSLSSVIVRVVDARTGAAPIGGLVEIDRGPSGSANVSASGEVVIEHVPPGLRRLSIRADGCERIEEWVTIEPGRTNDLGTRMLDAATTISGRVVDERGEPLQIAVELRAIDAEPAAARLAVGPLAIARADTQRDGSFQFKDAGRRRYFVQLVGGHRTVRMHVADARGGPVENVVLRVVQGTEIALTFPVEPPPGAHYLVETNDHVVVAVQPCRRWSPFRMLLAPGAYRVRLMDGARVLSGRTLQVSQGMGVACPEPSRIR